MPIFLGDTTNTLKLGYEGLSYQQDLTRSDAQVPYYSFSSHTFTPCGVVGRIGPTLAQMQTEYSGVTWAQNTSFLNSVGPSDLGVSYGIHKWLVPATGRYQIEAAGSPGGRGSDSMGGATSDGAGTYTTGAGQGVPGAGAIIRANFILLAGDILYILVGQRGIDTPVNVNNSDTDGGGGGGTFVAKKMLNSRYLFTPDNAYVVPLIVAGGGGGGSSDGNGAPGSYNNWQSASNWQNVGNGGLCLGGGFSPNHRVSDTTIPGYSIDANYASGLGGTYGRRVGYSFLEGGLGGKATYNNINGDGGFGGGAGAQDELGAGGGGWYGGLNGDNSAAYSSQGGTSYVSPEGYSRVNVGYRASTASLTQGYCTITYLGA